MADAKYRFCLTDDEKRELNQMVSSGKRNARQILDALILLNCDESEGKKQSDEIVGGFLKVGKLRVHRIRKRFFENGMSGVFVFMILKRWRGVATRYAKNTASFLAAVQIRCSSAWVF